MKRRLLNLLTALSLLLCVAVCVLWVRSDSTSDGVLGTSSDGELWWVICRRGRVGVLRIGPWPYAVPVRWKSVPADAPQIGPWMVLGDDWLAYGDEPARGSFDVRQVTGIATIENRTDGWSDYGPCTRRMFTRGPPVTSYRILEAPLWPAALLCGAVPLVSAAWGLRRRIRGRQLSRRGRCARCGYDLRATPGRCPECGQEAHGSPITSAR
jgi:hypothetical protein